MSFRRKHDKIRDTGVVTCSCSVVFMLSVVFVFLCLAKSLNG